MLQLNEANYYSHEADIDYFSASQIKSFKKCFFFNNLSSCTVN